MPQFRKKPVVIEARKLQLGEFFGDWPGVEINYPGSMGAARITTLEGLMIASARRLDNQGCGRRVLPLRPEIFHQTYEVV